MSEDDLKALKEIRASIDRWRRMLEDAEAADRNERDVITDAVHSEMGEALHTKFYRFAWWMP